MLLIQLHITQRAKEPTAAVAGNDRLFALVIEATRDALFQNGFPVRPACKLRNKAGKTSA
jgi:hypothetical protein